MFITTLYTTFPSVEEAASLASKLVELKLVACCNTWPLTSIYKWDDQVESSQEAALLCKTLPHLKDKAAAFIEQNHSYDVPLILQRSEEVNASYGEWMQSVLV